MFCELGPFWSIEASTERDACVLPAGFHFLRTISDANRGHELHSKLRRVRVSGGACLEIMCCYSCQVGLSSDRPPRGPMRTYNCHPSLDAHLAVSMNLFTQIIQTFTFLPPGHANSVSLCSQVFPYLPLKLLPPQFNRGECIKELVGYFD